MAVTRNHLTAHEYFTVSNYILKHLEELRALRGNAERARQVGEALNMTLTIPNLEHSARAANVSLSPPPRPKAEASGEVAEIIRALTERIEALEAALVRAHDRANEQAHNIHCLQEAARTALPPHNIAYGAKLL